MDLKEIIAQQQGNTGTAPKTVTSTESLKKNSGSGAIKDTLTIVAKATVEAGKTEVQKDVGEIVCDRLNNILRDKVPFYAKGYIGTDIGNAIVSSVAATILLEISKTDKAVYVSDALIKYSAEQLINKVNLPGIVSDLLEGIEVPTEFKKESGE